MMLAFPQIQPDKALHYIAGTWVYLVTLHALQQFPALHQVLGHIISASPRTLALAAAVLVGAAKEIADAWANRQARLAGKPRPHGVAFADGLATALGGLACWLATAPLPEVN